LVSGVGFGQEAKLLLGAVIRDIQADNYLWVDSSLTLTISEGQLGLWSYGAELRRLADTVYNQSLCKATFGQSAGCSDIGPVSEAVARLSARLAALPDYRDWAPEALTLFGKEVAHALAAGH
jgi:hypothetical protein